MNIFIAGGGRVGYNLARLLSNDRQDVTVIEADAERIEQIDYALDVRTARGNGSSVMVLQQIGVGSANLFVASMGHDETNLIAAATAKGLGAKIAVARVDNPMYVESNILYETVLGIDYILSPDALAALEVASYIEHPGVLNVQDFGRGLVQMRQMRASRSPTVNGKTLKDAIPPGTRVLLGVINRGGKTIIPHGDSVVEPGDHITLVGQKDQIGAVQRQFLHDEGPAERVAIMGGASLGLRLAKALEGKIKSVKIFERREDRAKALAEQLTTAKVVCRDAALRVSLEQEHIHRIDVFVAATNDDERNIMATVLAKELGARKVVAVVHQPDFAQLVERLGIDLAVTPRACIANRILQLVHQGKISSLAVLGEGQVEVIEFAVSDSSPLLNQPLKDIHPKFPKYALIASILRGDEVIVPSGDDDLRQGDTVILIGTGESLINARRLLRNGS